jgi:hypothetical protein
MRADLVEAVRGSFERGIDDAAGGAMLDLVVVGEFEEASRALVRFLVPRHDYEALIAANPIDAAAAAAAIAEAFLSVGDGEAAAGELFRFVVAFGRVLGRKAQEIVRQDELELDRQIAKIQHVCAWRSEKGRGRGP